jgi:tetratricopeptide (TPR) repeat protein
MMGNSFPTHSPEALRSFIEGRDAFQSYWGTQAFEDLERAHEFFAHAESADPLFGLASFYAAVTDNEARRHDSAIERLNSLARRDSQLRPEAYIQLAFAHAKKYTEEDYLHAEKALDRAEREARVGGKPRLLPAIESYRVFIYAVIGGRSKRTDRLKYLDLSIRHGRRLLWRLRAGLFFRRAHFAWMLRDSSAGYLSEPLLVEVQNALGIAYMRQGQLQQEVGARDRLWRIAEDFYQQALEINPNVVRVLQNQGTLRLLQGERIQMAPDVARTFYKAARDLYERTLAINSHDQFPHYRMAVACAKLGDWESAWQYVLSGRNEPGSVRDELWAELERVINTRDASLIVVK